MPVVEPDKPPSHWRLSERGRSQSVILAERLKAYGPKSVIASREPKATQTAEIVADHLGLAWSVAPRLHDRTGAAFGTREQYEAAATRFFDRPAGPV